MDKATKDFLSRFGEQVTNLRQTPYLFGTYVSIFVIALVGLLFWRDLIWLIGSGIASWEDARSIGLFIGGTLTPIVTFLTLHLSDARLREKKKQNDNEALAHNRTLLSQAIDNLNNDIKSKRMFGLITLQQPIFGQDRNLSTSGVGALRTYINKQTVTFSSDQLFQGVPIMQYNEIWDVDEATEAFRSLFSLRTLQFARRHGAESKLWFKSLGLRSMNFRALANVEKIHFENCDLAHTDYSFQRLNSVNFYQCSLKDALFFETTFMNCRFYGCDISGSDFSSAKHQDLSNLLALNFCLLTDLPVLPTGTKLSRPWMIPEDPHDLQIRRASSSEVLNKLPQQLHKYKALLNADGDLEGIEYTGDPNVSPGMPF